MDFLADKVIFISLLSFAVTVACMCFCMANDNAQLYKYDWGTARLLTPNSFFRGHWLYYVPFHEVIVKRFVLLVVHSSFTKLL
jgi:hypothetical protein